MKLEHLNVVTKTAAGIHLHHDRLDQPLHWHKPRRVMIGGRGDLFDEKVHHHFIRRVLTIIATCQKHMFYIVANDTEHMYKILNGTYNEYDWVDTLANTAYLYPLGNRSAEERVLNNLQNNWPMRNLWLGVKVTDQATLDERAPWLMKCPAAGRFLWYTALGAIDTSEWIFKNSCECGYTGNEAGCYDYPEENCCPHCCADFDPENKNKQESINLLIASGETGRHARPAHPDWIRDARDQCEAAGVAFNFQGWGEWVREDQSLKPITCFGDLNKKEKIFGKYSREFSDETVAYFVGHKNAGRLLDGREWDEWPEKDS